MRKNREKKKNGREEKRFAFSWETLFLARAIFRNCTGKMGHRERSKRGGRGAREESP